MRMKNQWNKNMIVFAKNNKDKWLKKIKPRMWILYKIKAKKNC